MPFVVEVVRDPEGQNVLYVGEKDLSQLNLRQRCALIAMEGEKHVPGAMLPVLYAGAKALSP